MKLECSRKELLDALQLAVSATSQRSSVSLLQTVRLTAEGSSLTLLGCDSEMWAERRILANVSEPGSICVTGSLLRELIAKLSDGQVTLTLEQGHFFIRTAMSEWRMLALPSIEYPSIPAVESNSEITLNMGEFRRAVNGVAFALAEDSSRPILTGVLLEYDGSQLTMVATDTHRLAVLRIDRSGIGSQVKAVVPGKALKAITSLPLDDTSEITISFDDTRILVDTGDGRVVSQLLMGVYPNWEKVVPAEFTRSWTLDRAELMDNLSRAMILAKDNANRVKFSGHGDQVTITARSEEKGEAKEEVATISHDGDIEIAFNGRYLIDALGALDCEAVVANMTEASRAAVFRPMEGERAHYCVIMPMALN